MLLKIARITGFSLVGVAFASSALAQDGTNVMTGADSLEVGGQFRAEWEYTDNGFDDTEDEDAQAASDISVNAANILLEGDLNENTQYAFRFSVLGTGATFGDRQPLQFGYGTHWFTDMIGVSVGKMRVLQGGWDFYDHNWDTRVVGTYAQHLVFDKYEPMVAAHIKAAGQITLQVLDDVMVEEDPAQADAWGEWNKKEKQTFVLGWMGKFGPVEPLINYGSFDNDKSNWIDVGVRTEMAGLMASLDYRRTTVAHKRYDREEDESVAAEDVQTAITVNAEYEVEGTATPWFYVSQYDLAQAETDDNVFPASEDVDYNTEGVMNDNGMTWGVGADLHMLGDNYTPYAAIIGKSGKWLKEGTTDEETESKSQMFVKIGAMAEI